MRIRLTPTALAQGTALQQNVTNPFYGLITTGPEAGPTVPRSYLAAPFPQFTSVYLSYLTGGYEIYNSFQLKVNKRLSHGLTLLVSYTGQKQIDDYSGIQNVGISPEGSRTSTISERNGQFPPTTCLACSS